MDENPYKAPQTEGGGKPPHLSDNWWAVFVILLLVILLGGVGFSVLIWLLIPLR